MSKKITAVGLSIIVVIIIIAFSAMSVVQSHHVAQIDKVQTSDVTDSSVLLSWKKLSSADGYKIYMATGDSKDYAEVTTVDDKKTTEQNIKDLEQCTAYNLYVTGIKNNKKGTVESEKYETVSFCTLPRQQKISSLTAGYNNNATISWEQNNKADGYRLQYIKGDGKDFTGAQNVNIKDSTKLEKEITNLKDKTKYSFRIRSYYHYNGQTVNGKWSKVETIKIEDLLNAANIDPNKPMIALTFDDGPGYNTASDDILDVLEKYNARATFFMVGKNAADHPENLKRKVKLGCEIGNHTYDHNHYGKNVTVDDIKKASNAIYKACGVYPDCFRSTGGNTTSLILSECKKEKMPLYYWSVDTEDWKSRNADSVYNKVMKNVKDGDIILMHEIYDSTADAVAKMVPELIKQGYQLVTCEELIVAKTGKAPQAGVQYVDADTVNNQTS